MDDIFGGGQMAFAKPSNPSLFVAYEDKNLKICFKFKREEQNLHAI